MWPLDPKMRNHFWNSQKISAGRIKPKIKILRARYEVKKPLPNGILSLLALNFNAFSCARPWTKFEGHTVKQLGTTSLILWQIVFRITIENVHVLHNKTQFALDGYRRDVYTSMQCIHAPHLFLYKWFYTYIHYQTMPDFSMHVKMQPIFVRFVHCLCKEK